MLRLACTFLLLLFPTVCKASCLPIDLAPNLQQEFESASLVARLQLIQPTQDMDLACGIQVFSENDSGGNYIIINTLPSYEIVELFKGPATPTTIPVVWFTDTGFRTDLPSFLTSDDSGGVLAFLRAHTTCQNETSFWIYEDDYEPIPYEMSECSYQNMPWNSVNDDTVDWLRQQTINVEETTITTTMTPEETTTEEEETTTFTTTLEEETTTMEEETTTGESFTTFTTTTPEETATATTEEEEDTTVISTSTTPEEDKTTTEEDSNSSMAPTTPTYSIGVIPTVAPAPTSIPTGEYCILIMLSFKSCNSFLTILCLLRHFIWQMQFQLRNQPRNPLPLHLWFQPVSTKRNPPPRFVLPRLPFQH